MGILNRLLNTNARQRIPWSHSLPINSMSPNPNLSLPALSKALAGYSPLLQLPTDRPQASVALILCLTGPSVELLFIERATHPNDPWSGHIAFPGGRMETTDPSIQATAERETQEEIGITLDSAACLGRLDDLSGTVGSVHVAGFAYALTSVPSLKLSSEVVRAFWIPLTTLTDPRHQTVHQFSKGTDQRAFPALNLLGTGSPLLWGLTYRFVVQLMGLIGHDLPVHVAASATQD